LAFIALHGQRRRDITTFYAFCRVIDDIADSAELDQSEKSRRLRDWREWLVRSTPDEPSLAREFREVIARYALDVRLVEEILDGVEMDLTIQQYVTFNDLRTYCYRVASAVGLVSIEIFGYRNTACKEYAVELGLALQLTNILRDVRKDLEAGRIYIPQEDLARFRVSVSELKEHAYNDRFVQLIEFEAARARQFFERAESLLPREDRRSMVAAEIMRSIYRALLERMAADRFRVFEKNYRLTKPAKAARVAAQLLKSI
jgi:phytoene synthase